MEYEANRRPLRWFDYITINIYWLGIVVLSQILAPLVLPLLIQVLVGEQSKGAAYGAMRLWALMVALLAQALMGMLSDRCRWRWGRRRPFILIGTLGDLFLLVGIGLSARMTGLEGYWVLFTLYLMLQITANTAHGAQQGLIPDLVSEKHRGRAAGIKAVLELPLPLILVALTAGPLIGRGNIWGALLIAMGVLVVTMLLAMLAPEERLRDQQPPLDWRPFLRLILMTALFTAVILGAGKLVGLVVRLADAIQSPPHLFVMLGGVGLAAMASAIGLGVGTSIRLSIGGPAARENPSFTWWVVNRLAFLVGAVNLSSFAVYFLQARLNLVRGAAAGPATLMMMFVGLAILISASFSGWIADRFSDRRLVAISGLVAAAGTLVAILAPGLPGIYAGGCLIGLATGLFYTANWALGTRLVPGREAGRYLGISNLAGAGAGAVGAYLGGPIADYFTVRLPNQPGTGYVLLFAIYGALFLFSTVALLGIKPVAQTRVKA